MSVSICGNWGVKMSHEELEQMPIEPYEKGGRRHAPAKHSELCEVVDRSFDMLGYRTDNHEFFISKNKHRMLNTFDITHADFELSNSEFRMIGATINTTDSSMAPHVLFGPRVFVCDNMTFSAEYKIRHKATPSLLQDIKYLVLDNATNIPHLFKEMTSQFEVMQEWKLKTRREVNDLFVRSAEAGVIGFQQIPRVKTHWDNPKHEEFEPRTMYSLYNAYTEYWKEKNPFVLRHATKRLDLLVGNHIQEEIHNDNLPETSDEYEYNYDEMTKDLRENLK